MSALLAIGIAYHLSKISIVAIRQETLQQLSAKNTSASEQVNRLERRQAAKAKAKTGTGSDDAFFLGKNDTPLSGSTKVKGVYFTSTTAARKGFVEENLANLQAAKGTAFVVDVKGSRVFFDTTSPLAKEIGIVHSMYDLPALLQAAHEKGLYVIGRFISIKDDGLSTYRPATMLKNPNTGQPLSPGWVDPQNPTVLEYNGQVICDLAAAGIDEINLDYIRMSTAYVGDLRVFNGQQKADRVEKFLQMARQKIDECGHRTKLGISTYAILGWNYDVNVETLGQDVKRFAPYVDIISPMAYQDTFAQNEYYYPGKNPRSRPYYLVYRTLTGYAKLLGEEHAKKLRPWIQAYSISAQDARDEMDGVYDAGACGFTFWSAGNKYAPVYTALKNMPTPPERCL